MAKHPPKAPRPPDKVFAPVDAGAHAGEDLEGLVQRLKIKRWDWLLIGDGSGSNWGHECGWGCVAINRLTFDRTVFWGTMNRGTVNFAEMMAYLQALNFIDAEEMARRKRTGTVRTRSIHVVTDSDYCRSQGSSGNLMPKRNGSLWRVFEDYQRHGLVLHWHHRPRTDVALNIYADALSKAARHLAKSHNVQETIEHDRDGAVLRTVYDFNS